MSEGSDIPVKIRVMAVDEATSAFAKASASAIQYEQKIAAYTQSKGANVQALKSMQGKLLTLQATKQQADATMMQARLEERLFQATHTHEQIMLRDLEQRLAVQRQMYAGNQNVQSLLTKTYEAEKKQMATGGGIDTREMRHILRSGAGMALGAGGGEIGSIASMGMMIGGAMGAAVAGIMLVGAAYKSVVEQTKKLVESQKEYNKEVRESAQWWAKENSQDTTSIGGKYRDRAAAMKEKAAALREEEDARRLEMSPIDKMSAGWSAILHGGNTENTTEGRIRIVNQRRQAMASVEAQKTEEFASRENNINIGDRQADDRNKVWEATMAAKNPSVERDRNILEGNLEIEGQHLEKNHEAKQRQIRDERDVALEKAKLMKHGTRANRAKQAAEMARAEKKSTDDMNAENFRAADERETHDKVSALKMQTFDAAVKRQEKAEAAGADQAMIGATERGYAAKLDVLKRGQQQELDSFTWTAEERKSLVKKQTAELLSLQREEDDALEEMAVHAAQTKMQIENRAATNSLRNDQQGYAAKIQEIKNQRDETNQAIIDKAEIDRERDPKKATAIDKQAKLDLQKNKQGANQEILQEGKAHAREVANLEWEAKQQRLETADKFNVMMLRAGHKFYEADKAEIENHLKEKTAAIQAEADRANALEKDPAKVAAIKANAKAKIDAATLDAAGSMKELRDQRLRESLSLALPQGGVSGHLTGAQAISREMNNPGRGMLESLAKEKPPTREQTDKTNGLLEKVVYAMTHNVGGTIESLLGQSYGGN